MTRAEAKREAELCKWIIRKFKKTRQQEVDLERRRIERQKEKHKYVFGGFQDRRQIEDAYGWGAITKQQFNEYTRIWDDVNDDNSKYEDRLRFIDRQLRSSQSNLEDCELIMKNGDPCEVRKE